MCIVQFTEERNLRRFQEREIGGKMKNTTFVQHIDNQRNRPLIGPAHVPLFIVVVMLPTTIKLTLVLYVWPVY